MLDIGGKSVLEPPTTIDGQNVIGISQTTTAQGLTINQTDYLPTSGLRLPVEIIENIEGLRVTVVYGPWNKRPHAKVHPAAVPFVKTWLGKS
jgi:hypothetical protein